MTLHVLAIDDSRTIRSLLRQVIEGAGFTCDTADDGIDGIARFDALLPDVVITDLNMPRLDGFGVITWIRGGLQHSRVPILVLTTETGSDLQARARDAGATGWIVKPFQAETLLSTLHRVAQPQGGQGGSA